jgi:hypothetical protein
MKHLKIGSHYNSVEFGFVDPEVAQRILEEGITENELEELLRDSEGGPTDGQVYFDGEVLFEFYIDDLSVSETAHLEPGNRWIVVKEEYGRASYTAAVTWDECDPSKFQAKKHVEDLGGYKLAYVDLLYDGKDLDLELDDGYPKGSDISIISPDGKSYSFEIVEEELDN